MAFRIAQCLMTLSDIQGHLPIASRHKCDLFVQLCSNRDDFSKVPNAAEILPKISTALVGCTSVTDRRQTTDRQTTDGRATAYSEDEREFTFAKNG